MPRKRKHLASLLKLHREKMGFPQLEVSNYFRYSSAQFVSNWERGLSSPPDDILSDLAELIRLDKIDMRMAILADRERELRSLGLR